MHGTTMKSVSYISKHREVVNNSAAQSVHKKAKKSNSFSKRAGVPDQWNIV